MVRTKILRLIVVVTFMVSWMISTKLSLAFDLTEEELSLNNCSSEHIGSCFDSDGTPVCNSSVTWDYVFQWGCNCDSECLEYGDCCFDYLEACYNASEIDEPLETASARGTDPRYKCVPVDESDDVSVWMIHRCAPNWNDDVIREKCETQTPLGFAVENIPVTGSRGSETYRNVYCALCNGIDESSVVNWLVTATPADDNPITGVWDLFENGDAQSIHDAVTLIRNGQLPAFISVHDSTQRQPRNCVPFIETCNSSFDGATTDYKEKEKACQSYISVVSGFSMGVGPRDLSDDYECDLCDGSVDMETHFKYFKNPHCAMCNSYTVFSCVKRKPSISGVNHMVFQINLLFDITISGVAKMTAIFKSQISESETDFACSSGEVFDLNTQSCLLLHAPSAGSSEKKTGSNDTNGQYVSRHPDLTCPYPEFITLYNPSYRLEGDILFYKVHSDWLQTKIFKISTNGSTICVQQYLPLDSFDTFQSYLSIVCSSLSVLCLITRVIIYCVNPHMHTFPGKLLLNLVIAILLAQVLYLSSMGLNEIPLMCFALAVALHYSWLANFSWMAVVSYDLCRTFRSVNTTLDVSQSVRRLTVYCLLGWLLPGCIVCTAVSLQISKATEFNAGYGENSICWIRNPIALLIFFITPLGMTVIFNTACFVLTFISLKSTSSKSAGNSGRSGWKALVIPCVKAFVIMGVTWNLALLEAFIDNYVLSVIFITVNSLQGTLIFLFLTVNIGSIKEKFERRIRPEQTTKIELSSEPDNLAENAVYSSKL
ncbi:uncharacterized protein [Ptychodera flava]|uniref:uncharacterized protein n=1 Tax=Ptychodera flava TaxID=63121 RepID=UPI003969C798